MICAAGVGAAIALAPVADRFLEAGLVLILAVDQFLDMGRSATNVIGNSVATAVVAAFEGELAAPEAAQPNG